MAKRSHSQRIGSRGQNLVAHLSGQNEEWIVRHQPDEDFGIDFEVELAAPEVAGHFLKFQVKASKKVKIINGNVVLRIKKRLLRYADSCRLPVVLVVADLGSQCAWYLWLQEWLYLLNTSGKKLSDLPESVAVDIPVSNDLQSGLNGPLKSVALWKTKLQILRCLLDAFNGAVSLESEKVCAQILDIVRQLNDQFGELPIKSIIAEVLNLGSRIWATEDGNRLARILFRVCESYGSVFDGAQIRQLVVRGDSYSRTGISALGLLYDYYPEHLKQLDLPSVFSKDEPRLIYYCKLRERYLGRKSIEIIGPKTDYCIDGWDLTNDKRDEILNTWANRGDSAILDYLTSNP